jgi:hypothetical protein
VPHLFWRRVKPVAVGPLRLCAHYFPPFVGFDARKLLEQVYYIGQSMSIGAAWEGVPIHPSPEQGTARVSPHINAGVLRAGNDNCSACFACFTPLLCYNSN